MAGDVRSLKPIQTYGLIVILAVFSAFIPINSPVFSAATPGIEAIKGRIDLRNWDFTKQGSVALSGEWQFYWNQLKAPGDINFENPGGNTSWLEVPGPWNGKIQNKRPVGSDGYATLALRVYLGGAPESLSLSIGTVMTAYELMVNGVLLESVGKVGTGPQDMIPEYKPVSIDIPLGQEVLDIVIRISNYHHRLGGPWSEICLGTASAARTDASQRQAINFIFIGSIFMAGLYHLCLYVLRLNYPPPLYLGLFCLLVVSRALTTGDRYLHSLISVLPWEILLKIEYLTFYLGVPTFALYIAHLLPKEVSRTVLRLLIGAGLLFSLIVLLFPAPVFSRTVHIYQLITLLACLYMLPVFVRAVRNRRKGIFIIIIGFTALFAGIVNDMLYDTYFIKTSYLLQAGMFVFIFCQAVYLSMRFSRTHRQLEIRTQALTREMEKKEKLQISLLESHEQFSNSRVALIMGLAKLAEHRDTDTGTHLERIREYTRIIATDLSTTKTYKNYITPDYIQDIFHSAILHDIGKIGIRDSILLKKGKLTNEEFEIMKTHTLIGGDALSSISSKVNAKSFLTLGKNITYYHHEKWNGSGYPKGLSGEDIPLSARITALADVYDALTSERPYKKAFSHEKTFKIIMEESGTHFDPDVAAAFSRQSVKFRQVRDLFKQP